MFFFISNKMKKTGLLILSLLLMNGIYSQDTIHLTLPQAIDIALSESPTIKIADKEIERIDYSKKCAWYALIPNVEGTGQYSKFLVPAKMNMFGQVMDSPTDFSASLGMTLSLPLFAPALWQSIQMTTLEMQAATEKANASKITLRNEVTKAYYNVLVVQDSYKVLLDGYALSQKNYEIAKKGYETGIIAAYDYISAEVQLNNLLPTILQAENGISQAKTYLKVLMGMDINVPLKVTNSLTDFEKNVVEVKTLREYDFENNPDLGQLDISPLQLQNSLQLQRTQRMPTLAAFSQYGYSGTGSKETMLNFGQVPIQVEASRDWFSQGLIVGLQLRVPLTGIFTNTIKEKQLKIQEEELLLQREQAKNGIHLQAISALNNMNKAVKQTEAARKSVELSEKAYTISSKRYENGAGTMIELQNAALAITQSRLSYRQAISEFLTAKADLDKLLGSEQDSGQ